MLKNLALTRGLIFADSAAGLLAPMIGRTAAHELVEEAAADVRDGGATLFDAILRHADCPDDLTSAALAKAFDPAPAVAAAEGWTPQALALAAETIALLTPVRQPE
jgi:3-carboxy-cis,cis-muconate cycloisomerase